MYRVSAILLGYLLIVFIVGGGVSTALDSVGSLAFRVIVTLVRASRFFGSLWFRLG